jgi:hypothetical protein
MFTFPFDDIFLKQFYSQIKYFILFEVSTSHFHAWKLPFSFLIMYLLNQKYIFYKIFKQIFFQKYGSFLLRSTFNYNLTSDVYVTQILTKHLTSLK